MLVLKHEDIMRAARWIAEECQKRGLKRIYPVPRGGVPVAYAVSKYLPESLVVHTPHMAEVVVDDVIDSGATRTRHAGHPFYAVVSKHEAFNESALFQSSDWVLFPWEKRDTEGADDIGTRLLQYIGEDPDREGLKETPARFLKAWKFWAKGYREKPEELFKVFEDGAEGCDEMVLVKDIPIYSHCEHHLAAIIGVASVAYIPSGKIIGLSKIARVVEMFARRLQVQERLTNQVADCLNDNLQPLGVAVIIRARHLCMESRGVEKPGAETVTCALRGVFKTQPETRAEFMGLVK